MERLIHVVCALLSVLLLSSALPLLSPMLSLQKPSFMATATGSKHSYHRLKMSTFDNDDGMDDVIGAPAGPLPTVSRCDQCLVTPRIPAYPQYRVDS